MNPQAPTGTIDHSGSVDHPGGAAAGSRVDGTEAEMASRLRMAVTRLHRRLRQQTAGGLTPSQASALASTAALGNPTLGALAQRESVQPPSMTRIVAGLEELGYITRVADPTDRRVARVALSAEGRRVLARNRSAKDAYLARQLHRMDPGERRALSELTVLLEHLVDLEDR
jgi:DNA-binding MarR family transcriptional regulator